MITDVVQNIVQPLLTEYAVLLVLGVVGWLMRRLPARMRLEIEEKHRLALHKALDTGIGLVFDAIQKHPGVAVPDTAITTILRYVRGSVPDAIARLGPTQKQLEDMARAKLAKAIEQAVTPADGGWRAPHVPLNVPAYSIPQPVHAGRVYAGDPPGTISSGSIP